MCDVRKRYVRSSCSRMQVYMCTLAILSSHILRCQTSSCFCDVQLGRYFAEIVIRRASQFHDVWSFAICVNFLIVGAPGQGLLLFTDRKGSTVGRLRLTGAGAAAGFCCTDCLA